METKDKKLRILEEAEQLFASQGFSGTSVREIAKAADVNVAMISYYFGSKEQLLMEIFRYRSDYLKTQVDDLLNNTSLSSWDKLDILVDHYVNKFSDNQHLHRIILREANMNCNTEICAFIMERKKTHYGMIRQFFEQGQERGEFNKEVNVLWLYTLLPGMTKHTLFNQDFMAVILEEETGKAPDNAELMQQTKDHLKQFYRKILEIK